MDNTVYGLEVDYSRDGRISNFGMDLLKQHYMLDDESSPQQAFARASVAYAAGDMGFAQRIYDYASKGWFMFSTPVLSNAPKPGNPWKSLPISCYAGFVDDNLESLIDHNTEIRWLSVKGGGTAGHWSSIRGVSKKSPGPIPFLRTLDSDMLAFHQSGTRRGSYAAYLDVSHPDIVEFIKIRTPTGGDQFRKCFNIHNAINVTDAFMKAVQEDSDWNLICPHSGEVRDTLSARYLWQTILETRFKTGEPYIHFIDTANRALPQSLKDLGLRIHGSNLCSEIEIPTSEDRTLVCCLLSVCCDFYDEWKETTMVQDLIRLLDNVMQIFINHAPPQLHKAIYSAMRERDLGLGLMGFHSYLQAKGIPLESPMAKILNEQIFSYLQQEADASSRQLAIERGEYLDGLGTGRRNAMLIAIAPNANSSIIADTSPSIEPYKSNAFTHKTRIGSYLVKNKHLDKLFHNKLSSSEEIEAAWDSVIQNKGSVQHLDFLEDWEKAVFKTAFEINQEWLVELAGQRQKHICQSQSLNLFFPEGSDRKYINKVHLKAWKEQVKSLYYLRTSTGFSADQVSQSLTRQPLSDYMSSDNECMSCHA